MADEGFCGCAICGGKHLYGVDVGDETGSPATELRIEALRAASRVVRDQMNPHPDDVASNTITVAEQFARWLEDG